MRSGSVDWGRRLLLTALLVASGWVLLVVSAGRANADDGTGACVLAADPVASQPTDVTVPVAGPESATLPPTLCGTAPEPGVSPLPASGSSGGETPGPEVTPEVPQPVVVVPPVVVVVPPVVVVVPPVVADTVPPPDPAPAPAVPADVPVVNLPDLAPPPEKLAPPTAEAILALGVTGPAATNATDTANPQLDLTLPAPVPAPDGLACGPAPFDVDSTQPVTRRAPSSVGTPDVAVRVPTASPAATLTTAGRDAVPDPPLAPLPAPAPAPGPACPSVGTFAGGFGCGAGHDQHGVGTDVVLGTRFAATFAHGAVQATSGFVGDIVGGADDPGTRPG